MSTQAQKDRNKRKRAKLAAKRHERRAALPVIEARVYYKTHLRTVDGVQPVPKNGKEPLRVWKFALCGTHEEKNDVTHLLSLDLPYLDGYCLQAEALLSKVSADQLKVVFVIL
jgi:hypothetical protein